MLALDSTLDFRSLILRVAEADALQSHGTDGSGPAEIPTDPADLDRIKRSINDAVRHICNEYPWSWLRQPVTITLSTDGTGPNCVESSPVRYRLHPAVVSAPYGKPGWRDAGNTYGASIRTCSYDLVQNAWASGSQSGPPQRLAVFTSSVAVPPGQRPGLEMWVWPTPDQAYTVTAEYSVRPLPLSDLGDRGMWPEWLDMHVIDVAAMLLLGVRDSGYETARAAAAASFEAAKSRDMQARTTNLGKLGGGNEAPLRQNNTIRWHDGTVLLS